MTSYLIPTLIFLLFCTTHSLFASVRFKRWTFGHIPGLSAYYRLLYNSISVILLIIWFISLPQHNVLYRFDGVLLYGMAAIQLSFLYLGIRSLLSHNGMEFFGIKQFLNKWQKNRNPGYLDEIEKGELVRKGFYRYMRHPMYTFVMGVLVFSPVMTNNLFYTIVIVGLYFWIGTYFEEKNLVKRFGEEYKKYQQDVPKFIPNPFK